MSIKYAENYTVVEKPVKRRGGILQLLPGQSATGYGMKIATDRCVRFGTGRLYRVYATCFSNAASHWIVKNGEKLFIPD